MDIKELTATVEFKIGNVTFQQIKDAIDSLESDHTNRNMLVSEVRGMKVEDIGSALMLIVFKFIQAEVIGESNGVTRIADVNSSNSIANLREATKESGDAK